jgi:hypothetical protein
MLTSMRKNERISSLQLGNDGEDYALQSLQARGYSVRRLPTNTATYDLEVEHPDRRFLISVKVSRTKQHVRLGTRDSVLRLSKGNFLFAYMPTPGHEIEHLSFSPHVLLIIPAEIARSDSLLIHDRYWEDKGRKPDTFSVMVKGYGSHHREMWPQWMQFQNAWHLLPMV